MVRFLVIGVIATLCAIGAARQLGGAGVDAAPQATAAAATETPSDAAPSDGQASIVKSPDGHFCGPTPRSTAATRSISWWTPARATWR